MKPAAALPMLGIDLGGTKIEAALLGTDGDVLWRQRVPTPRGASSRSDYRGTLDAIAALVGAAAAHAGNRPQDSAPRPMQGTDACGFTIGIGTPGTQGRGGLMKNCNSTCLNGQPLQHDLEALLQQRVALANDANCLALSEATDGAGAGADTVFAVILGTGVGGGIATAGRVLAGANHGAGEWGHNPLPWADPATDAALRCWCGQRGCIETVLSGPALARDHLQHGGAAADAATLAAQAAAGDAEACATLERHAGRLARALAAVINVLDPDVIVLGGGLSRMPHLVQRVPALWGTWVFGAASEAVRTRLVTALHGDASGVRGAAWIGRAAA